jgi:hypothetical protein
MNLLPKRILLAVATATMLLTGCGKTVLVTRGPQSTAPPLKTESVDGIPFYVKHAYCQQKAAWLEPQYSVKVTGTADDKPAEQLSVSATLSRQQFLRDPAVAALVQSDGVALDVKTQEGCTAFRHLHSLSRDLLNVVPPQVNDADLTNAVQDGNLLLAESSAQLVPYVDYQTVYYYNTQRPLTGTSQVDVKLAADGTMTEGSSQVNDQTLSSVTGVFSSLLSGAGAAAVPLMMASPPAKQLPEECQNFAGEKATFHFAYTVQVYQHTHLFKDSAATELACLPRPLAQAEHCGDGCSLTVTDATTVPAKTDPPTPPAKPDPAAGTKPKS